MDPVLDRVRAANPADTRDFDGLADFDALVLDPPRRHRRRLLALPALGAVIAALVLVPTSAPQASEILRRAVAAVEVDDGGILYARSSAEMRSALDGKVGWSGSRRVWVLGEEAMRWLEDDGNEEVYKQGEGITRFDPRTGKVTKHPEMRAIATEIFRAGGLLESARAGTDVKLDGEATVNGRPAYVLRWNEKSGPPHWPKIEMTLWVDKETFAPLRFTDHSYGTAVDGKPFDQTYTENVLEFKTLPDTPENRRLLEFTSR